MIKYLFEFRLRSDASAKFAPQNYWGMFPSWSAGWVISDEKWFDKDKTKIDFLKIRGSFGILGKDNVNAWLWTQLYTRNQTKDRSLELILVQIQVLRFVCRNKE